MAEQRIVFTADEAQHLDALRKILKAEVKLEEQMSKRNKTSKKTNEIKKEELTLEQRLEQEKAKIHKKELEAEIRAQARKELGKGELTQAQQVARVKKEILDADKQREYRAQALKELGREQNNEAEKQNKLVRSLITSFASYEAIVGAAKKGWQEINRIATAEREAQRNIGGGTIDQTNREVLKIINQNPNLSEPEARKLLLRGLVTSTATSPSEVTPALLATQSANMPMGSYDAFMRFAGANQMLDAMGPLIETTAKLDISRPEDVEVLMQKINVGQKNAPTDVRKFSESFSAYAPIAKALGFTPDQMIADLAVATKVTKSPDQASELSKEILNYMAKPELQKALAKYAGFGTSKAGMQSFNDAMPDDASRFALAMSFVNENSKTAEGRSVLQKAFSGREANKFKVVSTDEANQFRELVLGKVGAVTLEDARASIAEKTGTNAYQTLKTGSEGIALGLQGSMASQVGTIGREKSLAKYESIRSGEMGPEAMKQIGYGTPYIMSMRAALSPGVTFDDIMANIVMQQELSNKIGKSNLPFESDEMFTRPSSGRISQSELIGSLRTMTYKESPAEMGQLIILIDRLVELAEDGNTVTRKQYQELKEQIKQETLNQQRATKVGDPNNTNASN